MQLNRRWIPAIACLALTAAACHEPPSAEPEPTEATPVQSAADGRLPLKEIMVGLEVDLADVAHGIWIGDPEVVRAAAGRIADHPTVIPEQMGAIRTALGAEFSAFVQHDQAVHRAAVELAEVADSTHAIAESFDVFLRIQQGCMSCHAAFRERVTGALNPEGSGA